MNEKILVIDDEDTIRFTLEKFLSKAGYDVSAASTSDEALHFINSSSFDLIITDLILDKMSGLDLLKEIRRKKLQSFVVMITGAPDIETARAALKMGAYDYIPKPVTKESLLHVTEMALKSKSLKDEKEKYRLNLENVFKNIDYGIITFDPEGVVTDMNDSASQLCGHPASCKGKVFGSEPVVCNGACVNIIQNLVKTKESSELYRHECAHKHRGRIVMTISASPLFDSAGDFKGGMLVVRDDTRLDDLERGLQERRKYHRIIGKSTKMQNLFSLIQSLSVVQSTVLVTGESGTGKELVAEALHIKGNRRDKPLVKVTCSALQENLLESELFGHVKGAFTGATENKEGRFFKANGGTIFLDEIGDISETIQLKLLRVLQEKEFERVGDSTPMKIDVRIVTATNKDLRRKIEEGKFREDLYYRLNVMELVMPSLRDNREDIPLLVEHFIGMFDRKFNRNIKAVSPEVMQTFMEYLWPGNVRELEHAMEHAFIICNSTEIALEHLPRDIKMFNKSGPSRIEVKGESDAESLIQALDESRWNISKAARLLGMSRPTFYKKMRQFDLYDN